MIRNHVTKVASTNKKKALLAVDLGVVVVGRGQLEFDHGLLFNRDYGDLLVGLDEAG